MTGTKPESKLSNVSMDNTPIPKESYGCLPLKFGCVLSAITMNLYSVFAMVIAQYAAALGVIPLFILGDLTAMTKYGMGVGVPIALITLFLSTLMLVGALTEEPNLIRPCGIWLLMQATVSMVLLWYWSIKIMFRLQPVDDSILLYGADSIVWCVRTYMMMIVTSYYKQMLVKKAKPELKEVRAEVKMINNDYTASNDLTKLLV